MAYSNTTLPALPEYDTAAYPYAVALFSYGKGEEDWYQLVLAVSASAFKASFQSMDDGSGNVLKSGMAAVNTGTVRRWVCGEDGVWEEQASGDIICLPGLAGNVYQRVWTNHDILDESGNVWLAAGCVTPVDTGVSADWLRSFKLGLALGLTGKALPFKREPVAYLYNGVRLPKLPEWDKEKYPYAAILSFNEDYSVWVDLYVAENPLYLERISGGNCIPRNTQYMHWSMDGIAVQDWGQGNPNRTIGGGVNVGLPVYVWSNYDYLYDDGELYHSATNPVPVYTSGEVAVSALRSSDGYILQDANGLYLIPKEAE